MLAVMIIFTTAAYLYVQSLPEDYALQLGGMVITKKTLYVTIGVGTFSPFTDLITVLSGNNGVSLYICRIGILLVGRYYRSHCRCPCLLP